MKSIQRKKCRRCGNEYECETFWVTEQTGMCYTCVVTIVPQYISWSQVPRYIEMREQKYGHIPKKARDASRAI